MLFILDYCFLFVTQEHPPPQTLQRAELLHHDVVAHQTGPPKAEDFHWEQFCRGGEILPLSG